MLAHVFLNCYYAIASAKFISLRQRRTGLAEVDRQCLPSGDKVERPAVIPIKSECKFEEKCKFRDSSMVDPDKVGMLTGGFRNKKM